MIKMQFQFLAQGLNYSPLHVEYTRESTVWQVVPESPTTM